MITRLSAAILLLAIGASTATAESPLGTSLTYQGQLRNVGSPASGLHDLRFRLYDANTLGSPVGAVVCLDDVTVTGGLFTVALDFGEQFAGQERFLEIEVRFDTGLNCANSAGFTMLTPRQAITAAPNALFALNASTATSATTASNAAQLNGQPAAYYQNAANQTTGTLNNLRLPVPISLNGNTVLGVITGENTSTGNFSAGVVGQSLAISGTGRGVTGQSASPDGTGVSGAATAVGGSAIGVSGLSASTNGIGARGQATAVSGAAYGMHGLSSSTSGIGVVGQALAVSGSAHGGYFDSTSTSGRGVFAQALATSGITYGGRFGSASNSGTGVSGVASAASGATYGVHGQTFSASDNAVGSFGSATAASGFTFGGRFESASTSGIGVFGFSTATTGATFGVYGRSDSTSNNATGVYGLANGASGATYGGRFESAGSSGRGVYGLVTGFGGTTYGVMGSGGSGGGFAVFANGSIGATGAKPFRIDHPDDPANKYLLHYSAESPEIMNFYSETATLDEHGEAVVELPHYFAKINKRPRYQLTAVGAPMPMLHVATRISDVDLSVGAKAEPGEVAPRCSFRIAGGVPGGEVSWRVDAVRNDRWVQTNGAPVEIEKQGGEKGTYQHPELYNQPPEKGMNYVAEHERHDPVRTEPIVGTESVATSAIKLKSE